MALQAYATHPALSRIPTPIRAALYARVSTDQQREEATIESQLFELKRQVAGAGHELVREYIDDGYSGASLDRPALEDDLREAVKTDAFDAVWVSRAESARQRFEVLAAKRAINAADRKSNELVPALHTRGKGQELLVGTQVVPPTLDPVSGIWKT